MNTDGLSANAKALLHVLRVMARRPEHARTDKVLATLCHLPERTVIDAAGELLAAGHLVIASCKAPYGRFLLDPLTGDLALAAAYLQTLEHRAIEVLRRRSALKRALARAARLRAGRPAERQATLFETRPLAF